MITKCFVITEFGKPLGWTQTYINEVQHLKKDGWYWKIFTPNKYTVPNDGNVEIIPFSVGDFNDLVEEKLTIRPQLFVSKSGVPSVHITDFYVFTGLIFDEWLKDVNYWGITNLDIVYGNLSKFISDEKIEKSDIWTDDVDRETGEGIINGIFSLWKNIPYVNNLCYKIPNWQAKIAQDPCPKCSGKGHNHTLYGTDEIDMVRVTQRESWVGILQLGYPKYYPLHSYDRLQQHVPEVKLERKEDGSLWELFQDVAPTVKPFVGREIPYFHFSYTKKWPNIAY